MLSQETVQKILGMEGNVAPKSKGVEVQTIKAAGYKFETHSLVTKILRVVIVPLINNLPSSILKKMAGESSHDAFRILNNVGKTHALEVMYSRHNRKLFSRGILQGMADFIWHHVISQLKAIRNRLKIVEHSLEEEITLKINKGETSIDILTVGGGSCRAIIHSVDRLLKKYPKIKIKVTNVDKDANAIELGKKISTDFGVTNVFKWINDSAFNVKDIVPKNSFDIVEMVGLLDYFDYEKGKNALTQIYDSLRIGGLFIVANIYPNSEMKFVENVGWPKMCYRNKDDFIKVITGSGFSKKLNIIFEPLMVHIVGLTRK